MSGWFAMQRGLFEHPIFQRRPDRLAAWAWIVANAAWKDTRQDAGGQIVLVKRGQLRTSLSQMSKATGVGIKVIRTLLDRLKDDRAIDTDMGTGRLLITVRNYDKYQSAAETPARGLARGGHGAGKQKEQGNNIPLRADENSSTSEPLEVNTVTAALWDVGKRYLSRNGVKDPGRLIGRWLKQSGGRASSVLAAIEAAQKAETRDPVPYISKIINGEAKNHDGPSGAYAGAFGFIPEVG